MQNNGIVINYVVNEYRFLNDIIDVFSDFINISLEK